MQMILQRFLKDERSASQLFSLLNDFGTCSEFLENRRNVAWKPKMPLGERAPFNKAWNDMHLRLPSLLLMTPPLALKSVLKRSL